jgi:hypothetical protein
MAVTLILTLRDVGLSDEVAGVGFWVDGGEHDLATTVLVGVCISWQGTDIFLLVPFGLVLATDFWLLDT